MALTESDATSVFCHSLIGKMVTIKTSGKNQSIQCSTQCARCMGSLPTLWRWNKRDRKCLHFADDDDDSITIRWFCRNLCGRIAINSNTRTDFIQLSRSGNETRRIYQFITHRKWIFRKLIFIWEQWKVWPNIWPAVYAKTTLMQNLCRFARLFTYFVIARGIWVVSAHPRWATVLSHKGPTDLLFFPFPYHLTGRRLAAKIWQQCQCVCVCVWCGGLTVS